MQPQFHNTSILRARLARGLALAIALLAPAASTASTSSYNDQSAFLSAAGEVVGESFETRFSPAPLLSFPGFAVWETGPDAMLRQSLAPTVASDGMCGLEFRSDGTSTVTFSFAEPRRSFGITIFSFGNTGPGYLMVADDSGATVPTMLAQSLPQHMPLNTIFYGLVSPDAPFRTVTFTTTSVNDVIVFDGLSHAPAAIPEPAAGGLAAAMAAVAVVWQRRRRGPNRSAKGH